VQPAESQEAVAMSMHVLFSTNFICKPSDHSPFRSHHQQATFSFKRYCHLDSADSRVQWVTSITEMLNTISRHWVVKLVQRK